MALKDLMALYGRVGLIVAAFVFVAGIVAGPLLQKVLFSSSAVAERSDEPSLRMLNMPVGAIAKRQS